MKDRPEINLTITWVYTDDLAGTCGFYADLLGLELLRGGQTARIYRTSGDGALGVCAAIDGRVVEPKGGMITFVTDDVDGWFARLRDAGAAIREEPRVVERFGIYAFVAEDPNGYAIEFQQFLEPAGG